METSLLSWWQQRSTWRRTRAEGRHLIGEARGILKAGATIEDALALNPDSLTVARWARTS